MKKILITLMLCISLPMLMYAQLDTAVFNRLSPAAQQEIANVQKTQQIVNTAKEYSQIAGYGKEIGVAVRDGLYAVKDVTLELAESPLGKTTIWLIVWHVAGKDFVRIGIGLMLIIISIILVSKSYFRTFRRKVVIKDNGWFKGKEYQLVDNNDYHQRFWEYPNAAAIMHVLFLLMFWGISAAIMFA